MTHWYNIVFLDLVYLIIFLRKHDVSGSGSTSVFRYTKAPNLVDP